MSHLFEAIGLSDRHDGEAEPTETKHETVPPVQVQTWLGWHPSYFKKSIQLVEP